MNNKNVNCHPECIEGSQQIHISSRDIAENIKLNHEIAKELRKYTPASLENKGSKFSSKLALNRKRMGLNKTLCLLTLFTLLPTLAHAETCTATPDCKSLGYTETSCPDGGGVKCPWNTSLMYCPQCKQKDICQSCYVGWILNSDMTCSQNKTSGETPIGVVANQTITMVGTTIKCQGVAVALSDLSGKMTWSNANSNISNYSAGGMTGWRLPIKDELLAVYGNKSAVSSGLTAAGGTQFTSDYYWSSSANPSNTNYHWGVNLISGNVFSEGPNTNHYVRPVLAFEKL